MSNITNGFEVDFGISVTDRITVDSFLSGESENPVQNKVIKNAIDSLASTGLSAYDIAVANGYIGSEEEWLVSLKGEKGDKGDSGEQGIPGVQGETGSTGADGESAYEIAQRNGFIGTETEWLASLKGADGSEGSTVTVKKSGGTLTVTSVTNGVSSSASCKECQTKKKSGTWSSPDWMEVGFTPDIVFIMQKDSLGKVTNTYTWITSSSYFTDDGEGGAFEALYLDGAGFYVEEGESSPFCSVDSSYSWIAVKF